MKDYFLLLGIPRQPWPDQGVLRSNFLARSSEVHPDRVHDKPDAERRHATDVAAEINAAYQCLQETKTRLLHLLELERGAKPGDVETLPAGGLEAGFTVASLCRESDKFIAEHARVTSPLLKAQAFEKAQQWLVKIRGLQQQVKAMQAPWNDELAAMNDAWNVTAENDSGRLERLRLERLEELYRLYSYTGRWLAQLQERIVQLSW